MKTANARSWRVCFVLSALFLLAGGPLHPDGTMAEMLAHPQWVPSHSLLLVGFVLLLAGLIRFRHEVAVPRRTAWWLRVAMLGTGLQALEMALHTAAAVDHANLVAGRMTPVLTTHLWMSVIAYPIFGAAMIGLIVAAMRDRALGSPAIGWLGILGAAAHGAAAPLVVAAEILAARFLFPLLLLLALWQIIVGFMPLPAAAERGDGRDRVPA
jgi:hypothetical protein